MTAKRRAKPRCTVGVTGVFDLECAHWDRPVVAARYAPTLEQPKRAYRTVAELVTELLEVGGYWWAWAGGHFDTIAIVDELNRRGISCQPNMSGSRVTSLTVGKLHILDAYALVPMGLDAACELADLPPVGGIGWLCTCGEGCGGYCRIRERPTLDELARLYEYCLLDCERAYHVLVRVIERLLDEGFYVRGTIGGTAWATAQAWLELPDATWHNATWRRLKKGHYGGRKVVARAWSLGGDMFDMRSAYPAALRDTEFPIGPCVEVGGVRAAAAYRNDKPGIYRATVTVPESFLPPLPWRTPSGRLGYPHGTIRGSWTAIELQAAEERGCVIDAIHHGAVWPGGTAPIFGELIDLWHCHRAAAGPDSAWGRLYRGLGVGLAGKLAQGPERSALVLYPDADKIEVCDGRGYRSRRAGCTRGHCTRRCGAWKQVDPWGHLWSVPRYQMGASSHVHWGAYVTASSRIRHLEGMESVGTDLVYGHTDSVYTQAGGPPDQGSNVGQWAPKGPFADWECLGPGMYRYVDGATGEMVCRIAGMNRITDREWVNLRERDQDHHDERGVMSLLEAAATQPEGARWFKRRDRRTRLVADTPWRGDRRIADLSGLTYAPHRTELERRDRAYEDRQEGEEPSELLPDTPG